MKSSRLTLVTGAVLLVIFLLLLFTFQVPQSKVSIVTTFGRYSRTIAEPGLYAKMPWPIQRIYEFDSRIQSYESKLEQTATKDGRVLLISVFVGWRIADPKLFLERFDRGDLSLAEQTLGRQVRDTQSSMAARHVFDDFVSANATGLKFDEFEKQMEESLRARTRESYGIEVRFVGIRQLGLPESVTAKVFDRMKEERQRLVKAIQAEGDSEAIRIRAEAERQRQEILAKAEAEATGIRGQAEAEAAKSLSVFEQNPKLANFLLELKALEASLKDRATLILDQQTPPFNLLKGGATETPGAPKR
ncbi:MAG: protease modulator HflC [Verrucomicrobia bacterium]|nr:protease modulator HflC [Verrucomicrobiota bacterium]